MSDTILPIPDSQADAAKHAAEMIRDLGRDLALSIAQTRRLTESWRKDHWQYVVDAISSTPKEAAA